LKGKREDGRIYPPFSELRGTKKRFLFLGRGMLEKKEERNSSSISPAETRLLAQENKEGEALLLLVRGSARSSAQKRNLKRGGEKGS